MHWNNPGMRGTEVKAVGSRGIMPLIQNILQTSPYSPNSQRASVCCWHRNHKHIHTAAVRPASQPCKLPCWQTVCKNKTTNGQTFASPICASAFQDKWNGQRTLILQEKIPWTLHLNLPPLLCRHTDSSGQRSIVSFIHFIIPCHIYSISFTHIIPA